MGDVIESVKLNYTLVHKATLTQLLDEYEESCLTDGYFEEASEREGARRFGVREKIDKLLKIQEADDDERSKASGETRAD